MGGIPIYINKYVFWFQIQQSNRKKKAQFRHNCTIKNERGKYSPGPHVKMENLHQHLTIAEH